MKRFLILILVALTVGVWVPGTAAQTASQPVAKKIPGTGITQWTQPGLFPECGATAFLCRLNQLRNFILGTEPPFGRSIALLVGVSGYEHFEKLPWVEQDVDRMRKALLANGFDVVYVVDENWLTEDRLDRFVKVTIHDELKKDDRFLFYFSGHGADLRGNTGYMLFPSAKKNAKFWGNSEAIPNSQLIEWSGDLAHAKHVLFILDSCSSGLGFEHVKLVAKGDEGNETLAIAAALGGEGSREVLTAGTSNEKAYGNNKDGSLFTRAILELLEEGRWQGALLTARSLHDRAVNKAASAAVRGIRFTPQRWKLPEDPGRDGTFVFINPNTKATAFGVETAVFREKGTDSPEPTRESDEGREVARQAEPEKHAPSLPRPTMIRIPGGTFEMGSNTALKHEEPVHTVTIPSFEMSKTEVTVAQYQACVDAGACDMPGEVENHNCNGGKLNRSDHPMNCVSWNQAKAYVEWVEARLPSEAEWEFAARSGGTKREYPWGDEKPDCKLARIDGCGDSTAPVCSTVEGNTEQGLCDMVGNVREWVEDDWHGSYVNAPADHQPWIDQPQRVALRVVRGGSWWDVSQVARVVFRLWGSPSDRYDNVGFRVARSLPSSP